MGQITFSKTNHTAIIQEFRAKLYHQLTAPIDAMWEELYIRPSQHYIICYNEIAIGYCSVSSANVLLQLFLKKTLLSTMGDVIKELIRSGIISSASLSTNEPILFNSCLLVSKKVTANTFCYEHFNVEMKVKSAHQLVLATHQDIPAIQSFFKAQVGMEDTIGYTKNLVERDGIFVVKASGNIIATSECRMSESQPGFADLGVIVGKDYQGKGMGREILQMQVNRVLQNNRKPICSTTLDNIASQRMIQAAGFYCSNIIFDLQFV